MSRKEFRAELTSVLCPKVWFVIAFKILSWLYPTLYSQRILPADYVQGELPDETKLCALCVSLRSVGDSFRISGELEQRGFCSSEGVGFAEAIAEPLPAGASPKHCLDILLKLSWGLPRM